MHSEPTTNVFDMSIGELLPAAWQGRRFGLLKGLLWARKQVMTRRALWIATGADVVDSIPPFISGWLTNTHFNGGHDLEWLEFQHWVCGTKGEPLDDGWPSRYLRDCQGDHEKAALRFLDLVAEYIEHHEPGVQGQPRAMDEEIARRYGSMPETGDGRQVRLLDAMLWARQQLHQGRELSFITGGSDIESLLSFTCGWTYNSDFNGRDDDWWKFTTWLVDVKKACFSEWHVTFLRDCQGDHQRAALRLMDFAAEYAELERTGRQ